MSTQLNILEVAPPDSKAARLAKLLPAIEAALLQNYSHEVIFEHIKKTEGLELTYKYYKTTLHRLRKKRDAALPKEVKRPSYSSPARRPSDTPRQVQTTPLTTPAGTVGAKFKYDVKEPIENFFS